MANAKPSLKKRLHAWWEGYDLPRPPGPAAPPTDAGGPAPDARGAAVPPDGSYWHPARLKLLQMVFGTGFISPSGKQTVLDAVKPLNLDGSTNFLDIGAGLGGGARAIAADFGAYVTGMDLDSELVEVGRRQVEDADLEKKAALEVLDVASGSFREGRYAGAVIRDTLCRCENRLELLDICASSIRSGGQIIIQDLFLADPDDRAPMDQWYAGEPVTLFPTESGTVSRALAELGLDVRVDMDVTAVYADLLLNAWSDFVSYIEDRGLPPELTDISVEEAERWARRLIALRSGDLVHRHIVGSKP